MMKVIFASVAVLVMSVVGVGCAGHVESSDSSTEATENQSNAPVESPEAAGVCPSTKCATQCGCEYATCMTSGQTSRECDEERFQCILCCKPTGCPN